MSKASAASSGAAARTAAVRTPGQASSRALSPIALALAQGRVFIRCFADIAREGLRGRLIEVLVVTAIDMASAAAGGGVIAFLGYVAARLQQGDSGGITVVGFQLAPEVPLALSAVALFLMLGFAATAGYFSAVRTRAIGRAYHQACVLRMIDAVRRAGPLAMAGSETKAVGLQLTRNALHLGKSLESLLQMIKPFCYMLVGLAIILHLDASVLVIMIPAFLLVLPVLYLAARRTDRDVRAYFQVSTSELNKAVQSLIGATRFTSAFRQPQSALADAFVRDERINRYFDDFDSLQLANNKMGLITAAAKALTLSLAFFVFGWAVIHGQGSWGHVLALLGAILLLLNNIQSFANLGTNLLRFYPQASDYLRFYRTLSGERAPVDGMAALPISLILEVSRPSLPGSGRQTSVGHGRPLLICDPLPLSRNSLGEMFGALATASGTRRQQWEQAQFISRDWRFFPGTVRQNLLAFHDDPERRQRLQDLLDRLGLARAIEETTGGLDSALDQRLWAALPPDLKLALRLLPLALSPAEALLVDANILREPSADCVRATLELFKDRHVLIVFRPEDAVPEVDGQVVVVRQGKVAGIGPRDWLAALKGTLVLGGGNDAAPARDDEETLVLD